MKIWRGCTSKPKQSFVFEGKDLERCPIKTISRYTFDYIQAYSFFKKGYLPNLGTYLHQPAKLLDIFSVIENKQIQIEKTQ